MISYNQVKGNTRSQESFILWAVEPEISLQKFKAQPLQTLSSFQFNEDESKLAIGLTNDIMVLNSSSIQTLKSELKLSEDDLGDRLIKANNFQKLTWLHDNVSLIVVCYEPNPSPQTHPSSKIFTYNTETKE